MMDDLISRQAAIDEIDEWIKAFRENGHKESAADACLIQDGIIQLPSVQPDVPDTNVGDMISRQAAIDAICKHGTDLERIGITYIAVASHKQVTVDLLEQLPSVQPKLIKAKIGHDPTVDKTEILKKMLLDEPIVLLPSVQPEIIPLPSETPCDVCRYNPPSSMDGKPCCICPAEGRAG